ncbi:MAG: hypothetical protein AAGF85_22485, partial [Bacteroidota bacterium]
MKYLVPVLIILIISCSTQQEKEVAQFSYPPEWAPHEAIWTDFNFEPWGFPSEEARLTLIATLAKHVKTKVVYDNDSL